MGMHARCKVMKFGIKVGPPPCQDESMWGMWGGGPGHGGGRSPACASILHQYSSLRNQVFTLISGQVFPLLPAVGSLSFGRPTICQRKVEMSASMVFSKGDLQAHGVWV